MESLGLPPRCFELGIDVSVLLFIGYDVPFMTTPGCVHPYRMPRADLTGGSQPAYRDAQFAQRRVQTPAGGSNLLGQFSLHDPEGNLLEMSSGFPLWIALARRHALNSSRAGVIRVTSLGNPLTSKNRPINGSFADGRGGKAPGYCFSGSTRYLQDSLRFGYDYVTLV
jgi:hypothetical protein